MGAEAAKSEEHLLIVQHLPLDPSIIEKLQREHPNLKITVHQVAFKGSNFLEQFPDELYADATILSSHNMPSIEAGQHLKFIQLNSAGINHVATEPLYTGTDIPICTTSGIHGPPIAEWAVMQILSHQHHQKQLLQWQKEHNWAQKAYAQIPNMRDSVGLRLGVLGYGSIGRQTARVAKALGMDVIAYTASPRSTPESKRDTGYIVPGTGDADGSIPSAWFSGLDKASLQNFLAQDIDFLLISVPLTAETTHFLGREEFEILGRRNAYILNISRGQILQQDDLIAALKRSKEEGGLSGAALDVTDPEPLDKESELWDLENVFVTPHVSAINQYYYARAFDILSANIGNLENGRKLVNQVDRKRGY